MKAKIYVEDSTEKTGFREIPLHTILSDAYAFDGLSADIIQIQDVWLHGTEDLDRLIKMLVNARPCFQDGDGNRNYFK